MARNQTIKIRVTDDELAKMKSRADDLSLSEFVRVVALDEPMPPRKVIQKCDPELIRAVNRIGNNINQIAKQVNAGRELDNALLLALLNLQTSLDDAVTKVMGNDS